MTVLNSGISWCTGTLNLTVGCTEVSPGCDNCYARELVNGRFRYAFKAPFHEVVLHEQRLRDLRKFKPQRDDNGRMTPPMIFVNSLSDFWHDAIPDDFIDRVLDEFERWPDTVFQILTKRPIRMRRVLTRRYANRGVPDHLWFGVTAECNEVAKRLDILRSTLERVGDFTAFASVEPIVGATDKLDFSGLSWVITGGESGLRSREMLRSWLMPPIEQALSRGIALWHKQNGSKLSHPNFKEAPPRGSIAQRFGWLIEHGWEVLPEEKGGATVDRKTYRELPPSYHRIADRLSGGPALPL